MRRVRYHAYGDPEVLTVEEAATPRRGPGQVLLDVEAIGTNFIDTRFRRDVVAERSVSLPGTLTGDVVGTVVAIGDDVPGVAVGDRVAAMSTDAYGDQVLADAGWLTPVPSSLDAAAATMLPMLAPLALGVLRAGKLAAGETVLVHAAAGGVGHLIVQLAKVLGAGRVIATASSGTKLEFARACGADVLIDYTADDWAARVRAAAPEGVDVVADATGGGVFTESVGLLAPFGRAVAYGILTGAPTVSVTGDLATKYATGYSITALRAAAPERARSEAVEAAAYVSDGRLKPAVHARLRLEEAAEAHRLLEDRANLGRIVLTP